MEVNTHRVPTGICPIAGCHRQLDAASGGSAAPAPGDVTICAYCKNWLVFYRNECASVVELQLREITEEEIADLDDEAFQLLTKFSRIAAGVSMRRTK